MNAPQKMWKAGSALAALVLAVGAAYWYLENQIYHPVVRLALPGGLNITAVLPDTKERLACDAANQRFAAPFKQNCKDCTVAAMTCERRLEGLEQAMREGAPLPHPVVVARDLRMAIIGPPAAASASCQFIAADMVKKGQASATCVPAQDAPKS
jgi:hypothetical protein